MLRQTARLLTGLASLGVSIGIGIWLQADNLHIIDEISDPAKIGGLVAVIKPLILATLILAALIAHIGLAVGAYRKFGPRTET